jgi:hypothetical protein
MVMILRYGALLERLALFQRGELMTVHRAGINAADRLEQVFVR